MLFVIRGYGCVLERAKRQVGIPNVKIDGRLCVGNRASKQKTNRECATHHVLQVGLSVNSVDDNKQLFGGQLE